MWWLEIRKIYLRFALISYLFKCKRNIIQQVVHKREFFLIKYVGNFNQLYHLFNCLLFPVSLFFERNFQFQYKFEICNLYNFTANIISVSHGCALGWLSPYLPLLQSDSSPLTTGPISLEETSWIGAILCVGGVVGNSLFGFLCNWIGRKRAITLLAFPNMVRSF